MNLFLDNPDLQHHFREGVCWERFVPLWEDGFRFEDGPRSLEEARDLYRAVLEEGGDYAAREVAPRAREIDEEGVRFEGGRVVEPAGLLRNVEGLRRLGVLGVSLPREVGGSNFPFSAGAMLLEVLGRACTNTLLRYVFFQGPALTILRHGTPDQVQRWVVPLAAGDAFASVAMTEPEAGSDVGQVTTAAVHEDGRWRVTGRKQFITNGHGDLSLVLARSAPGSQGLDGLSLLIVPRLLDGAENFKVARPEKKFVIRGSATCELSFDGSGGEMLGEPGQGFRQILGFMNEARVTVAVQGLGIAEAALQAAKAYAGRRVQMGRPIARHPMIADLLLDMEAETAALRALIYRCTELQDRIHGLERRTSSRPREIEGLRRALRDRTPLVKWFGSERVLWIARAAVQVHGGYGVVQEYDVERHYRNALILPIYEGTSQIQSLMSLKDQVRWAFDRPWRLLGRPVRVEATPDPRGDALRDMADEYNRALKRVVMRGAGVGAIMKAMTGRREDPRDEGRGLALLHAERLLAMLAHTRAAEALLAQAVSSSRHRALYERFVSRALPLVHMYGEVVRSADPSALEAAGA